MLAMVRKWVKKSLTQAHDPSGVVNEAAQHEMREVLGTKYESFCAIFAQDTSSRLQAIEDALATEGDLKSVALNAHSISSSSAYMGAVHLSALASALENKAAEAGVSPESLVALYNAMKQSFATIKTTLQGGKVDDAKLTAAAT
jgi:HPt (histidine-containing phosphotransfer) domain-containing protein